MAVSAARSAAVTGSKLPAEPLFSTPSEVRKNGRMASPDTVASRSTKAAKSTAVMRSFQLSYPAQAGHPVIDRSGTNLKWCGLLDHPLSRMMTAKNESRHQRERVGQGR